MIPHGIHGIYLRMRFTKFPVPPLADCHAIADDDAAYQWIRTYLPESKARKVKGPQHESFILCHGERWRALRDIQSEFWRTRGRCIQFRMPALAYHCNL